MDSRYFSWVSSRSSHDERGQVSFGNLFLLTLLPLTFDRDWGYDFFMTWVLAYSLTLVGASWWLASSHSW